MGSETCRWVNRGDAGLALAERQPGSVEDDGEHMVAMADMVTIIVVTDIRIARHSVDMVRFCAGVKIMIMGMYANSAGIATKMPMHAHRRRPGELERNNQQKDQGNQAAHGADANSTRACRTMLTEAVNASRAINPATSRSGQAEPVPDTPSAGISRVFTRPGTGALAKITMRTGFMGWISGKIGCRRGTEPNDGTFLPVTVHSTTRQKAYACSSLIDSRFRCCWC